MKKLILLISMTVFTQLVNAQTVNTFLTGVTADALSFGPDSKIYASNNTQGGVSKISLDGTISSFAAAIPGVAGSVFDDSLNLIVASYTNGNIYKINPSGNVSIFVSLGIGSGPAGITKDVAGNIYAACSGNQQAPLSIIKKITPQGQISDFATGTPSTFYLAGTVAFDNQSNLYVGGFFNTKIYKIEPNGNSTLFTTLPTSGTFLLYMVFKNDFLYVPTFNNLIHKIDLQGNSIVFAGNGSAGNIDGPALQASFNGSNGLTFNTTGDSLFVSEFGANRIRLITGITTAINNIDKKKINNTYFANNLLEIDLNDFPNEKARFELYDVIGKLIWNYENEVTDGNFKNSTNLTELKNGIYFLTIKLNNETYFKKLIK